MSWNRRTDFLASVGLTCAVLVILVVLSVHGNPHPLLWTGVGVGTIALILCLLFGIDEGVQRSTLVGGVSLGFGLAVGLPIWLYSQQLTQAALWVSSGATLLGGTGLLLWLTEMEPLTKLRLFLSRGAASRRPQRLRNRRRPFYSPGHVSMLVGISGILIPLASVAPLIDVLHYGSTGRRTGSAITTVAMAGAILCEAVALFLLLQLILLWLRTNPSRVWQLEAIATETRARVAEEESQQGKIGVDLRPNDTRLIREYYRLREIVGASGHAEVDELFRELQAIDRSLEDSLNRSYGDQRWKDSLLEELDEHYEHLLRRFKGNHYCYDWIREERSRFYRRSREVYGRSEKFREDYYRARDRRAEILNSSENYALASAGLLAALCRPLMSPRTAEVNARTALNLGLVVDIIWPRIQVVLPNSEKREVARLDRSVAVSRVVAASAACTAVGIAINLTLSDAQSLFFLLAGPITVALAAILVARRRLGDAYERRATLIELYRFDLLRALRLEPPRTSSDLIIYGDVLMGGAADERVTLVSEELASASAVIPNLTPQLDALRDELTQALSERVVERVSTVLQSYREGLLQRSRLEVGSEVLGSLAELVGRRLTDPLISSLTKEISVMQREVLSQVRDAVQESVTGEPLIRFVGFLTIDLLDSDRSNQSSVGNNGISVGPGGTMKLRILVFSDGRAKDALPERESNDAILVALQPVQIESDRTASVVEFAVIIDSPSLIAAPHRLQLRVPEGDAAQGVVSFDLPDHSSAHEVWIQLYQSNRLVEVIALPIEVQSTPSSMST